MQVFTQKNLITINLLNMPIENRGFSKDQTKQQTNAVFASLKKISKKDLVFFIEQFQDMKPIEKKEFIEYLIKNKNGNK